MERINGLDYIDLGGGKRGFRGRDVSSGIPGTEVTDDWLNDLQEEVCGVIEYLEALDGSKRDQLLRVIRKLVQYQRDNYVSATGTANAITLTLNPVPASWAELVGVPLRIKAGASANTGSVTVNPNGLGAKSLMFGGGIVLTGGELQPSVILECVYNGTYVQILDIGYTAIKAISLKRNRVVITATGSGTFTVPQNVTTLTIKGWGAGGGGGHGTAIGGNGAGSGGSSGAYFEVTVSVVPGQVISYQVGAGGAAGFQGVNGSVGGDTTVTVISTTYTAAGGPGGLNANAGQGGNSPGSASVPPFGDIRRAGAQGLPGLGNAASGIAFAGAGGSAYLGGLGGVGGGGTGSAGLAPGGGGGGSASGQVPGTGARGEIVFEY